MYFRNYYRCERCLFRWDDVYLEDGGVSCPQCKTQCTPYRSEELSEAEYTPRATIFAIRALNDNFRKTFTGGRFMRSAGIAALSDAQQEKIFDALKKFDGFTPDNDPSGERNHSYFEVDGSAYIFTIDYYDVDERFLSDDPSDPKITKRVGVLMLAEEY